MERFVRITKLILLVVGLITLTATLSVAQDPLEVGPDIYKLLFENERVRVMEITFKPGDKIGTHSHPDHMAYLLTDGKLLLSYPDGTTKDLDGKAGEVIWINAETHAAENVGTTEVKGVVIELKEAPVAVVSPSVEAQP